MKSKLSKAILIVAIVLMTVMCLIACDNTKKFTVKIMDGEEVLKEIPVADGDLLGEIAGLEKAGYKFVGLYTDKDLSEPFVQNTVIEDDITLYAKFERSTSKIIVTNVEGTPTYDVSKGNTYNLPELEKPGETFLGYFRMNPDTDEWDVEFPSSGTYELDSDVRLRAKFNGGNTYKITIDENGGNATEDIDVVYGQKYSLPTVTRTGYTFAGWKKGDEAFTKGATYDIADNITLVAQWAANTYTITLVENGGDNVPDLTVHYGEAYTLPTMTRAGYTFVGWTRGGVAFTQTDTYTFTSDIELNAQWATVAYTITIDENGGEEVDDVITGYGAVYYLPEPVREGYQFMGWLKDGDSFAFEQGQIYTFTNDITLVAVWMPNIYEIKYDTNGGSAIIGQTLAMYGLPYSLRLTTRIGYTFTGWTLEGAPFVQTDAYTFLQDITLVAQWTANTYTITIDENGGSVVEDLIVTYGEAYTLPTVTKYGYDCVWTKDGASFVKGDTYDFTTDITLVATWTPKAASLIVAGWNEVTVNGTYGAAYALPDPEDGENPFIQAKVGDGPTNEWSAFYGYGLLQNEQAADFAPTGTIDWEGTKTVYPRYAENQNFTEWKVSFHCGAVSKTIYIAKSANRAILAEEYPVAATGWSLGTWCTDAGYEDAYDLEAAVGSNLDLYATYTANTYTITIDENGGSEVADVTVTYGMAYNLPTPTRTGYTYVWTKGGAPFVKGATYDFAEDITLVAQWTANTYTITIHENGGVDVLDVAATYGEAYTLPTMTRTGYTFNGWKKGGVSFVKGATYDFLENIILDAQWTANNYTITIVPNGGSVDKTVINVTYGQAYEALPIATRTGYTFVEWQKDGVKFTKGNTYDIAGNITLVAQWSQNNYTITIEENGGDLVDDVTNVHYGAAYTLPTMTRTGYTFTGWKKDGVTYEPDTSAYAFDANISLSAQWSKNSYTITLRNKDDNAVIDTQNVEYGAAYSLPTPVRFGFEFDGFEDENGAPVADASNLICSGEVTYYALWIDQSFIKDVDNKYFKEVEEGANEYTYVLLTGYTYKFEDYILEGGEEYYQSSAFDTFVPNAPGEFRLTMTPTIVEDNVRKVDESRPVRNIKVKTVYDVKSFSMGSDYNNMITSSSATDNFMLQNASATYRMAVGINNYKPDVVVRNDKNEQMSFENGNIEITVSEGGEALADGLVTRVGNVFSFSSSLLGRDVEITLKPKYAMQDKSYTLKVSLNNGVNVYNNAELKSVYANTSVHQINILRNIKAALVASDYLAGHGEAYGDVTLEGASNLTNYNIGAPKNEFSNGVYTRLTSNLADRVVINGNYFTIDGSTLPYINNAYDQYGSSGSKYTTGAGYRIANVQIGIFLYRCFKDGNTGNYSSDGVVSFNNLRIQANNTLSQSALEDLHDGDSNKLIKMSASYLGMVVRGGTVNMDNVRIQDTCMGFMLDGGVSGYQHPNSLVENETHATKLNLSNCIVDNSWATAIYSFDLCATTLSHTILSKCSGPIFQQHDRPYGGSVSAEGGASSCGVSNLVSKLVMDTYTAAHLDSWISGDEAWFTAYGFASMAGQVKGDLESGMNSLGLTLYGGGAGKEQMMNFAILCLPTDMTAGSWTANSAWQNDPQGGAALDLQIVEALDAGAAKIVFFYGDGEQETVQNAIASYSQNAQAALYYAYVAQDMTAAYNSTVQAVTAYYGCGQQGYVASGQGGLYLWIPVYPKLS